MMTASRTIALLRAFRLAFPNADVDDVDMVVASLAAQGWELRPLGVRRHHPEAETVPTAPLIGATPSEIRRGDWREMDRLWAPRTRFERWLQRRIFGSAPTFHPDE